MIWSGLALADVDPDCFAGQDSITCALNRADDAKAADRLFAPIIEKSGWAQGCFTVQYIKGDNCGPDALMIMLYGPKGGTAPSCRQPEVPRLDPKTEHRMSAAGARLDELTKAMAANAEKVNAAKAASVHQRTKIGKELKKAVSHAPKGLREELLRNTNRLNLGSGYSEGVELALP